MVVQAVLAKIVHIFPFQVQDVADAQGGVEPKGNQRIVSALFRYNAALKRERILAYD